MDHLRLGASLRAVRLRLGWRQADVARRAGVSTATVSRLERGHGAMLALSTIGRIARVLEIRIDIVARWRGGELDRMLAAGHARMADHVARLLESDAWLVATEATFAIYGERGSIDILAFHPPTGTLLVVELKTEIVDVSGLLAAVDRYRRLAARIAAERGWHATSVSVWVVIRETRTNRRRVADHRTVLRSTFPDDGRRARAWLRAPDGRLSALSFLTDSHQGTRRPSVTGVKRVRVPRASVNTGTESATRAADANLTRSGTPDSA